MHPLCMFGVLAGIAYLMSVTQVLGQQVCKPSLAFKEVHFSEMQPPTLKRTWTAVVSVDTAGCAAIQTALRNCTRDEGRSFEFGNQVLISSHRKLLWTVRPGRFAQRYALCRDDATIC